MSDDTIDGETNRATVIEASYLHCTRCGKRVSTPFFPVPTDTPDRGLVVRAYIQCPECVEKDEKLTVKRHRESDR